MLRRQTNIRPRRCICVRAHVEARRRARCRLGLFDARHAIHNGDMLRSLRRVRFIRLWASLSPTCFHSAAQCAHSPHLDAVLYARCVHECVCVLQYSCVIHGNETKRNATKRSAAFIERVRLFSIRLYCTLNVQQLQLPIALRQRNKKPRLQLARLCSAGWLTAPTLALQHWHISG